MRRTNVRPSVRLYVCPDDDRCRCAVHWLPIDICRRQSSSSGPRLYTVRSEGGGSAQTCQNAFLDLLNFLQLVTTHADPFIKKTAACSSFCPRHFGLFSPSGKQSSSVISVDLIRRRRHSFITSSLLLLMCCC